MDKFKGCGKAEGTQIWRIEKFVPVDVPKGQYGTFYSGDSYLVLHTYREPGSSSEKLHHDIFFWQGAETSQDEAGASAIGAKELDDALGGSPVQHREVMGEESDAFLQLFPRIRYLKGGIESGFKHFTADTKDLRLLQITSTGVGTARMTEVPRRVSSLTADDAFVLDADTKIYVYQGAGCSVRERIKANEVAAVIRENKAAKMIVIDVGDETSDDAVAFYGMLAK